MIAAEEAIAEVRTSAGTGDFPGPLFLAVAAGRDRVATSQRSPRRPAQRQRQLRRPAARGRRAAISATITSASLLGSVADHLADRFGTKGSPISLSTACASGATAIQLGVEAIRRGETDAALCVGTDGSVNRRGADPLLAALGALDRNDPPQKAAKPFSKNRDGFVMAEGAGALVLESLRTR